MKQSILSIAVVAAALFVVSCQKENLQENDGTKQNAPVFTASIESGASTKTTVERIDGTPATYKTKWVGSDEININGSIYQAAPDGTDATKATFTIKPGEPAPGETPYSAYFPAEMFDGTTATLPASYTYVEDGYNMPMYAQSDNTTFSFKNLCGVLAITVNGEDIPSVSSIVVSSDKRMNGEFTAAADGTLTFKDGMLTDAARKVALNFSQAKSISGSATFYIPVPAGTHNPLTIKVSNGSDVKIMVTKKSGGVAVARNTVYPIAFGHNVAEPDYVEMKMGSNQSYTLKWATMNLGATSDTECGRYYQWGETEGHEAVGTSFKDDYAFSWATTPFNGKADDYNSEYFKTFYSTVCPNDELALDYDAARQTLGGSWRMPTFQDFQDLVDACGGADIYDKTSKPDGASASVSKGIYWCPDYDGASGALFCDGENKLFFPAAGYGDKASLSNARGTGYYWARNLYSMSYAYYLLFGGALVSADKKIFRYNGLPIRPVSD